MDDIIEITTFFLSFSSFHFNHHGDSDKSRLPVYDQTIPRHVPFNFMRGSICDEGGGALRIFFEIFIFDHFSKIIKNIKK